MASIQNKTDVECEYCKCRFTLTKNLKFHQNTVRSCLEIQKALGKHVELKEYDCPYSNCNKKLTSKLALKYHIEHCKVNLKQKQLIGAVLTEEVEQLKKQLDETNRVVQALKQNAAQPSPVQQINTDNSTTTTTTTTNSHNTTNNHITINQWMTEERIVEIFRKNFAIQDMEPSALAKFTMKNLVNGTDKPMYLCTDQSRQRMVYYDASGNEQVDKDCALLIDKLLQGKKTVKNIIEDEITGYSPEEIAQLNVKPMYQEFKNLYDSRSFKLELSKGLPNTPETAKHPVDKPRPTDYDSDEPEWDINERLERERQERERVAEAKKKQVEVHVPNPKYIIPIPIVRSIPVKYD